MPARGDLLELAILGLLHDGPLHGYELRRRLDDGPGAFRVRSFGTLYPRLRSFAGAGLIVADSDGGPRSRITYGLTTAGRDRFAELVGDVDEPGLAEEDAFALRVSLFRRTEPRIRRRVLEARRRSLADRLAAVRRRDRGADSWATALDRRDEVVLEHDLQWLAELLAREERLDGVARSPLTDPAHPAFNPART